jgi:hypothetical protein
MVARGYRRAARWRYDMPKIWAGVKKYRDLYLYIYKKKKKKKEKKKKKGNQRGEGE